MFDMITTRPWAVPRRSFSIRVAFRNQQGSGLVVAGGAGTDSLSAVRGRGRGRGGPMVGVTTQRYKQDVRLSARTSEHRQTCPGLVISG